MTLRESQILAEIFNLSQLITKIDNYSQRWLNIRSSNPVTLEQDEKLEYYELYDRWVNATEELKSKISQLTKENSCSPILQCRKDKLLLGYDSDTVKGYKIIESSNLKWFKELNLPIGKQHSSFEKYINPTKQKAKFSEYITEKMVELK
jgi:hypothetical protein